MKLNKPLHLFRDAQDPDEPVTARQMASSGGLSGHDHAQYLLRSDAAARAGLDATGLWFDPSGVTGGVGLDGAGLYVEV